MKVSEALSIKLALESHSNRVNEAIKDELHHLESIGHTFSDMIDFALDISNEWLHVLAQSDKVQQHVAQNIAQLDYFINGTEIANLCASKKFYQDSLHSATPEFQRKYRILHITKQTAKVVRSRISYHVNWKLPGLEIGPGDGTWTKRLVGFDPLYLVDTKTEYLESTMDILFNPQHAKRIRPYITTGTDLSMLPQTQFGFVFSWNVFNYFPIDIITKYLNEVFAILRSGGVFMFSYNNAERPTSMVRVENNFMTYVPKTMLVTQAKQIGFEILQTFDEDSMVSWIELLKPGKIISNRASQTFGRLIQPN